MNQKELKKNQLHDKAKTYLLKSHGIGKKNAKLIIIIKSVSYSGMSRRMQVVLNGYNITYLIADLCYLSINDNGLQIKGCGMDMTFWLANYITSFLWGKNKPKHLRGNGGTCLPWLAV